MALVPKSDYRVIDDWYSQGMPATGFTIELDNVFIPKHRLNTADARAGKNIGVRTSVQSFACRQCAVPTRYSPAR